MGVLLFFIGVNSALIAKIPHTYLLFNILILKNLGKFGRVTVHSHGGQLRHCYADQGIGSNNCSEYALLDVYALFDVNVTMGKIVYGGHQCDTHKMAAECTVAKITVLTRD